MIDESVLYHSSQILHFFTSWRFVETPNWTKSTGVIFPTADTHFMFLCHILLILTKWLFDYIMSVLMFSLTGGSQTTRTHGHKKGSNRQQGLLEGEKWEKGEDKKKKTTSWIWCLLARRWNYLYTKSPS